MTTQYDPPGITDPENVDGLTHQQIVDAFAAVANSTSSIVVAWKQGDADLTDSTTEMLAAVRNTVDGAWTGAAADAAVATVARYCDDSLRLPELFDEVSQVVGNTAMTAVMTKSFLPPVVEVTADQSADPEGFDLQTRQAQTAQAEARRIMAERYVVGFQDLDAKLPTFPAAMAIGDDQTPQAGQPGSSISGGPNESAVPRNPASTEPAGTEPEPAADPVTDPNSDAPTDTDSEPEGPSSDGSTEDGSTDTGGQDDSTQTASTTPTSAPTTATPTPSVPGDSLRAGTPYGGPSGGAGLPGGQGGSSPVPSPGAVQPPGSAGAGGSPGTRGGLPAAAHAGGTGMHGMPGAAGRGGGRGDEPDKSDKKVSLTHGDNTTELLGVIKHVPPVIGDR
ncbi:hypothetical protein ACFXK0_20765 [Nocardia sp. NPDC059177]|uniref:hypothetical protein n=1 Tax=Nocardia sp. NPDC059177 TaxID=3346759 RepID=UPI0036993156